MMHVLKYLIISFVVHQHGTAKVSEMEDTIREVYQHSKDNRKETGRLEGIKIKILLLNSTFQSCNMLDLVVCVLHMARKKNK